MPLDLTLLFRAAPLVRQMIWTSPSNFHDLPAYSFWDLFGTGVYLVLWQSSSVSTIISHELGQPAYLFG